MPSSAFFIGSSSQSKSPQMGAFALRPSGVPYGSRTRVASVKGMCPRPLDEGDSLEEQAPLYIYFPILFKCFFSFFSHLPLALI